MLKIQFCRSGGFRVVSCFAVCALLAVFADVYAQKDANGMEIQNKNQTVMKKETFIVIYKPGAAWIKGKPVSEQPLKEHGKYLLELYKSGILRFAGPFADDTGGAAVLEVADEAEAKKVVEQDPAVTSRVMVYELHPWRLVPWENYLKK